MKRRDEHGRVKISLHQADAVTPELIISVAPGLDKKEPDHQQCIENNDAVMNIWLAERHG
jgi:hypothetical protein